MGLLAILLFISVQISHQGQISDQRLCGNKFCTVTLSLARTLADYDGSSEHPKLLKFKKNEVVSVTSKSAGSRQDLWGGEVKGIAGFFPKSMVKEYKVYQNNPQHVVDIEKGQGDTDKKDTDLDETDLDETDLEAQDIVKSVPKNEPKKEETEKSKKVPEEETVKKEKKEEKAAGSPAEKKEEKASSPEKAEEEKKDADETDIDDTEVADSVEESPQEKKEEKSAEPAEKPPVKSDKDTTEQTGESKTSDSKPTADSGEQSNGEAKEKPADKEQGKPSEQVEKKMDGPVDTPSEKPTDQISQPAGDSTAKPSDEGDEAAKQKSQVSGQQPVGEQPKKETEKQEAPGTKLSETPDQPKEADPHKTPTEQSKRSPAEDVEQASVEQPKQPPGDEAKQPAAEQQKQAPVEEAKQQSAEQPKQPPVEEAKQPLAEEPKQAPVEETKQPAAEQAKQPPVEETKQPSSEEAKQPPANETEKVPAENSKQVPSEESKQAPHQPPSLKIADIKVSVHDPNAVSQPDKKHNGDALDLKQEGRGVHMDMGDVKERQEEKDKVQERDNSKDGGGVNGTDQPQVADPNDVSSIPSPQASKSKDETLVDKAGPKDSTADQPSEPEKKTEAETEKKIHPTPTQESVETSKTDSASQQNRPETPHPSATATDTPATEASKSDQESPQVKEPEKPADSVKEETVKDEPKVDATPQLQPSQSTVPETESTQLTEDELKSQKLFQELERAATEMPSPESPFRGSEVNATQEGQEKTVKPSEPSLPPGIPGHEGVKSKEIVPTPLIVLPGQRTVLSMESKAVLPPETKTEQLGTAVGTNEAQTEGITSPTDSTIQPTPSESHPPGTKVPETKPEVPQAEDVEKPPTPQVPPPDTPPNTGDVPSVEQEKPSVPEAPSEPDSGKEKGSMSTLTKTAEPLVGAIIGSLPEEWRLILEKEPIGLPPTHTVLFLLICLIFSIIVSLKCVCGGGDKAMVKLKERLQKVEQELFVANKQKDALAQSIQEAEDKASTSTSSASTYEETNKRLQLDISTLQLHNSALKQSVQKSEEEVATLSQSLETVQTNLAHREQESIEYQNQVYQLHEHKTQLEYQAQESQSLLAEKERLVEELEGSSAALNEEITLLQQSKQQLLVEADDWNEKVKELQTSVTSLESQTKDLQDSISFKENEIEVLKDCFMQLKVLETENEEGDENDESGGEAKNSKLQEKVAAMINVSRMNAILQQVEEDKASLQQKLVIETESRQEMEEQMKHITQEMESLKMNQSKAERESAESMTKLSVLSSYFKEKELQMQKELGEQLTQKKAKEGELEVYNEKSQEIEQKMAMYRSQVEDLKKEISNIERDFRNQISTNEKKAHENWLAARAAERDLKEAKAESAILRQKLTDLERRREFMDHEGLIRPLPTRGMPLPMMMNGPPPPPPPGGPDRPGSRSSGVQPSPSPHHLRDGELGSPNFDRLPPPPLDRRPFPPPDRPLPPPGRLPMDRPLPPPLDRRGPPPMGDMRSPPLPDRRPSMDPSPPFDRDPDRRYPPPPERFGPDRRSPPFRPDMPPPPRMGPGGPPYPGPPRGPPLPRREPFPPEPYLDRQGPKSTSTPKR